MEPHPWGIAPPTTLSMGTSTHSPTHKLSQGTPNSPEAEHKPGLHFYTHLPQGTLDCPQKVVVIKRAAAIVDIVHGKAERLHLFKPVVHLDGLCEAWVQRILYPFCSAVLHTHIKTYW